MWSESWVVWSQGGVSVVVSGEVGSVVCGGAVGSSFCRLAGLLSGLGVRCWLVEGCRLGADAGRWWVEV